jgi:recombination protein RecR
LEGIPRSRSKTDFTYTAQPVARLIEKLHKLPGIGPKSAQRLAYFLLRTPEEEARALAEAIIAVKERIVFCSQCQNITEIIPCAICRDEERDHGKICVVEEPMDVLALERTRGYDGLYHVLHGVLSPMDGVGPEDLKIKELLDRLRNGSIREIVLATNANLEGEATAMYLYRLIAPLEVKLTRLARGLPFGSDLEYADEVTLTRALEGRQEI